MPESKEFSTVPKVAEIKISVSRDADKARDWVKESSGHRVLNMYRQGYTHEDIERMGVSIADAEKLDLVEKRGASEKEFESAVTDSMVDAIFIAGAPGDCAERMVEVQEIARS